MSDHHIDPPERIATGVSGLDELLHGGLPEGRVYLLRGGPGTGKTTLGLQFLNHGAVRDEEVLYISLLQSAQELRDTANSHGWSLDKLTMVQMPSAVQQTVEAEQTVFTPGEVELNEVSDGIIEAIREHRPTRLVLDSVSELQLIVDTPHQLRRQLMRLKQAMIDVGCTAILTASDAVVEQEPIVQTIVHGTIALRRSVPPYGESRRQLEIEKVRGMDFASGVHDFVIRTGGLTVFPRFSTAPSTKPSADIVPSGNAELDELFGGGLNAGSACLIMGTSGAGKSLLASLYTAQVAERGQFACVYCFDESRQTFLDRSRGMNLGIVDHVEAGRVDLRQYGVGDLTPGQFLQDLRDDVDQRDAKLVVVDSFTGYLNMMPHEEHLVTKLHEVLRYLSGKGVLTLVTVNLHSHVGSDGVDLPTSYLADAIVLLRHFEAMGSLRKCIAMLKRRHGAHEQTIREVETGEGGLRVGPPLHQFSGLLTGTPRYEGGRGDLFANQTSGTGEPQS